MNADEASSDWVEPASLVAESVVGYQPLRSRTKAYALAAIRLFCRLPKSPEAQVLGRQLLRSATSVGAHWREGHRSRSTAEFVSKIEVALQELDESGYWLELLSDSGIAPEAEIAELLRETNELTSILVASVRTAKSRV
jgi:four helix bundle protein